MFRFPAGFTAPLLAAALVLGVAAPGGAAALRQAPDPVSDVAREATVMVRATLPENNGRTIATATGTGFLVAPRYVVTCLHVTRLPDRRGEPTLIAKQITVEIDEGNTVRATVVDQDRTRDLALLRLESGDDAPAALTVAPFSMRAGEAMIVMGDFPDAVRVTRGKLRAPTFGAGFAMGDAKVRSGFSGGPVLDSRGRVQGILSKRDDFNNSIFVRSDAIVAMLDRNGIRGGAGGAGADGGADGGTGLAAEDSTNGGNGAGAGAGAEVGGPAPRRARGNHPVLTIAPPKASADSGDSLAPTPLPARLRANGGANGYDRDPGPVALPAAPSPRASARPAPTPAATSAPDFRHASSLAPPPASAPHKPVRELERTEAPARPVSAGADDDEPLVVALPVRRAAR